MVKTQEYFKKRDFKNVTFIKNLERKYGTYNIVNSAFTACDRNDVQILVDGDDELIGR